MMIAFVSSATLRSWDACESMMLQPRTRVPHDDNFSIDILNQNLWGKIWTYGKKNILKKWLVALSAFAPFCVSLRGFAPLLRSFCARSVLEIFPKVPWISQSWIEKKQKAFQPSHPLEAAAMLRFSSSLWAAGTPTWVDQICEGGG